MEEISASNQALSSSRSRARSLLLGVCGDLERRAPRFLVGDLPRLESESSEDMSDKGSDLEVCGCLGVGLLVPTAEGFCEVEDLLEDLDGPAWFLSLFLLL